MNPYSPPAAASTYLDVPPGYGSAMPGPSAVSEVAVEMLRKTRPWVMFLGILAFVGCAFLLLAGLMMIGVGLMAAGAGGASKGAQAMLGAVYLPMAALYVYPGIKMWSYGSAIGRLTASRSMTDLEAALTQQKSLWKFAGIAAIAILALYLVALIGGLVWGVAAGTGKM
ncbi:MAG TPA: hypothetical protein VGL81_02975 [Polyangiaceae bacterium]|jgi:hypothetical protein